MQIKVLLITSMVIICMMTENVQGAKIMGIPIQMKSHAMEMNSIFQALQDNGHEVYMIVSSRFDHDHKLSLISSGVKFIQYDYPEHLTSYLTDDFTDFIAQRMSMNAATGFETFNTISMGMMWECEYMMKDQHFLNEIRSMKFDLAMVEEFPLAMCSFLLPHVMDIPYVSYGAALDYVTHRIPFFPSINPFILSPFSDQMNIFQRLLNTVIHIGSNHFELHANWNVTLLDQWNTDPDVYTWKDLARKAKIVIVPRDFLLEFPQPLMPHTVYVGGVTNKPAKPTTGDIGDFLDRATDGAVVVSMGSIAEKIDNGFDGKLTEAFSMLNMSVLWKYRSKEDTTSVICEGGKDGFCYEDDSTPDNIMKKTWIPQNDVLGHPNVKAFITHGGNKGQYEAVYQGVPMICFAIFAEQYHNCERMKSKDYGIQMDWTNFQPADLANNLKAIAASDSKYNKMVKQASFIMRSKPKYGAAVAAEWIDYVLNFDVEHLRSPALQMSPLKFYMVDILAIVFVQLLLGLVLLRYIYKSAIPKAVGHLKMYINKVF